MITDRIKKMRWEKFTPTQKHMILMYLYRTETDLDNIEKYIETKRVRDMKVDLGDLPEIILNAPPEELKTKAYAVIGAALPATTDYSNFLPERTK